MKMKLYALSQWSRATYDAAGKAMQDVFSVLRTKHAKTIWSMPKSSKKYLKILDLPYLIAFLLFRAGKKDYIFYSIPENHIKIRILEVLHGLKHYKLICFINDLNAIRHGDPATEEGKKQIAKEMAEVGVADYVLAPNQNSAKMLREYGVQSQIIPIGVWDYLMTPEMTAEIEEKQRKKEQEQSEKAEVKIAYAGNLNKAEFLSVMSVESEDQIDLQLWGIISEERKKQLPAFCHYNGKLPADEIPAEVCVMDYGLVWDGSGVDEIEGNFGLYTRYNNSHKCGLYLASGIPVIVWDKGGVAAFVKEHHCGICIERLSELSVKLQSADYERLLKNAKAVAKDLREGRYLSEAFDRVLGDQS